MRLYLKEKNLDRVAGVALAGITPTFTFERKLEDSEQGTTGKTSIDLPIKEDGAYLVLVRSGDVFASSLALISSLKMEVQEYDNTVRVTVLEDSDGKLKPLSGVHVKASNGQSFLSDETDLRGTVTLEVNGGTGLTVVSRRGEDEYAFFRSSRSLPANRLIVPTSKMVDFSENIRSANMMVQQRAAQQLRGSFGRRSMNEMGVTAAQAKR
jgi:hypothetical protein